MTFLSAGDFVDTWYFLRQKGLPSFLRRLHPSPENRIRETWKCIDRDASDWWIIPRVRRRINAFISRSEDVDPVRHTWNTCLKGRESARVLSVGSGGGTAEIQLASLPGVQSVTGIDISPAIVNYARRKAEKAGTGNVKFLHAHAMRYIPDEPADLLFFNSSLHHFSNPGKTLESLARHLVPGGWLIFNEYTGPDRFQWTREQLRFANEILHRSIPEELRSRRGGGLKDRCYRPGWLRSVISDPSESARSSMLIEAVEKRFERVQLSGTGGNILHILLKDIAHNFCDEEKLPPGLLEMLFREEDRFLEGRRGHDFTFGIYLKKKNG